MRPLRESRHGMIEVITGPYKSGKSTLIKRHLNSASAIWSPGSSRIILAKHPLDDPDTPDKVGGYDSIVTDDPDVIAEKVTEDTEAVYISGVNFFEDRSIVDLLISLSMSNRKVYVSGHNLDWEGSSFNHMPAIMAMADSFVITDLPCTHDGCNNKATRSTKFRGDSESAADGRKGQRSCVIHHDFPDRPVQLLNQVGGLRLFVGSMYASKTTSFKFKMKDLDDNGIKYTVFKWSGDVRYSERKKESLNYGSGMITMHNTDDRIKAIIVNDAEDIRKYIDEHTLVTSDGVDVDTHGVGHIFIDEMQFIKGISDLVREYILKGYRFFGTGLMRTFTMDPFDEIAGLLTLAEDIDVLTAYCDDCHKVATESQRLVKKDGVWVPAAANEEIVVVGGKESGEEVETKYEARCKDCLNVPGMPELKYKFPYFIPETKL